MEGYKYLRSYILATIICDLTVVFCRQFVDQRSRTVDQMVQAARSGKQNIAEGSSGQSLEGYIRLLGVAAASMKELTVDYEDYLRQHQLTIWSKDDPRVQQIRRFRAAWLSPNIPNTPNLPNNSEIWANTLLTYCLMDTYLLDRQIAALKQKFVTEGGFRENLFQQRQKYKRTAHS